MVERQRTNTPAGQFGPLLRLVTGQPVAAAEPRFQALILGNDKAADVLPDRDAVV